MSIHPGRMQKEKSLSIDGEVTHILFMAKDLSFGVLRLMPTSQGESIVVVGALGHAKVGDTLHIEGIFEEHSQYGKRIVAHKAIPQLPVTLGGIEQYLTTLRGFGPESAKKLIGSFGLQSLDMLENDPWRVAQIRGIGKRRVLQASEDAKKRKEEREVMVFLQSYGISAAYASRIRNVYGSLAITKVQENPYALAKDIPGIGFLLADQIARKLSISPRSPIRMDAAILHLLERASDAGHCYLPKDELLQKAVFLFKHIADKELLAPSDWNEGKEVLSEHELTTAFPSRMDHLQTEKRIWIESNMVFLYSLYEAEQQAADRLATLALRKPAWNMRPSNEEMASLSPSQQIALSAVCQQSLSMMTGGPGTGKTTLIRTLTQLAMERRKKILLLAPTGRAARRLAEATGHSASTIHRAMEWNPSSISPDRTKVLDADLIVCDEASMIDILILRGLLSAIPPHAIVIFVGDVDQLPSVGPGRALADMIESSRIHVSRLKEVFRQAAGSMIIQNAHRILHEEMPISSTDEHQDFYWIDTDDTQKAQDLLVRLHTERIPKRFGIDPVCDIQVLTPMHRGEIGTEALNARLQKELNLLSSDAEQGQPSRNIRFFVGDKVMQTKNDYERDVWNGDVGIIQTMRKEQRQLWVLFDERLVLYKAEQIDQLELAYAISIHKSQGSEYPAVLVPIFSEHTLLLQKNLLYTAVTRGKKLVVLLGPSSVIHRTLTYRSTVQRYTTLGQRIIREFDSRVAKSEPENLP